MSFEDLFELISRFTYLPVRERREEERRGEDDTLRWEELLFP